MAGTTTNLGLYFKDPLTDGNDTFNIQTMLNDNWNKLDAAIGDVKTPASKMGLSGDLSIGRCLNVLANIGNLHVWERVLTTIDASYVERRVNISDANIFSSDYQSSSYYAKFNVADSIDISYDGVISLVSPTQVTVYFQSGVLYYFNSLKGKYISLVSTASNSSSSFPGAGNIGYVSSDAEVSITASSYYQAKITSGAYKVYSVFVPAGTTTDYLTSTDRNAYTEGTVDNTTITYLGQLGGGGRIEVGSYVGTGTESADILLGFTPKAVLVSSYSSLSGSDGSRSAFILPGLPNEAKVKRAEIIDGGFRVYYYSSTNVSYSSDLNYSGSTFRYIAIG